MVSQNISQDTNSRSLISFLVLAFVLCTVRSAARWWKVHVFQLEDFFLWLALIFFIVMCTLYLATLSLLYRTLAVTAGTELPWSTMAEDIVWGLKMFFAVQILFWATLWSVKLSLLFMFRRLTLGLPKYGHMWLAITVFTVLAFVGCVVSQFTSCSSMTAWFTPGGCELPQDAVSKAASLWYSLAVDLLTDLLIMVIPIRLLWNLRISRLEKISVGMAFCVGILTMVVAVIRVVSLDYTSGNGEVSATWLVLWAGIEGFVAILVGCLPAFAVFVRSHVVGSRIKYTDNTYGSQPPSKIKSRVRAESVLLHDVDPGTIIRSNSALRDNTSGLQGTSDEEQAQEHKTGRGY